MASSGNRKHGRNKVACKRYRDEGRQEKAKQRRMAAHAERYPKTDKRPAAERRAIGKAWLAEKDRRERQYENAHAATHRQMLGIGTRT